MGCKFTCDACGRVSTEGIYVDYSSGWMPKSSRFNIIHRVSIDKDATIKDVITRIACSKKCEKKLKWPKIKKGLRYWIDI